MGFSLFLQLVEDALTFAGRPFFILISLVAVLSLHYFLNNVYKISDHEIMYVFYMRL